MTKPLISDEEIEREAFAEHLHVRCFDKCEFKFARRIEALVRKRLAERLRTEQGFELRSSEGSIQGSRAFGAAARIVEGTND